MKKGKHSLLIPSSGEFLSNKKISDRLYVWLLQNGEIIEKDIYIDKKMRNAYKELGVNYRTFYRRIEELVKCGYLIENEYKYKISGEDSEFKRYIYEDIVEKLYETKIDNIIKVYVFLSSLYSSYGDRAWFNYNSILAAIGYSHKRNMKNQDKVKVILEKLVELGLIKYSRTYIAGEKYQIKFKLLNVKTR